MVQDEPSASTEVVLRQVVKEHPPLPAVAIHRSPGLRQRTGRLKRQRKRPGTVRIPGLQRAELGGRELRAPLSRTQSTLAPTDAMAHRNSPAHRHEQRGERDQPLQGSVDSNDVARFHDEVLVVPAAAPASRFLDGGEL
jgi:hypothetical protein